MLLMGSKVIIDKDVLGWGDENEEQLSRKYKILRVGKHPELPQRIDDKDIASYCIKNNCDLLTGDSTSYTHFFDAGAKTLMVTRYDWWKKADKPIFLIQIGKEESH